MVVIFAHFVPFWIKKGIFTRVEPSGDAPQWPPEVLPVLRHTNHSHKILGGSKKRFFEYLGWATPTALKSVWTCSKNLEGKPTYSYPKLAFKDREGV